MKRVCLIDGGVIAVEQVGHYLFATPLDGRSNLLERWR